MNSRGRRCIYFVEGECERTFVNAMKIPPSGLIPGKVKICNVAQNIIPKSYLMAIQSGTIVALIYDTDKGGADVLSKNIQRIRKYCGNVTIVTMAQVDKFEHEIERGTDVKSAHNLTKSRSEKNFKTALSQMKPVDCRNLLERHNVKLESMWITTPPEPFSEFIQNGYCVKQEK